MQQQNIDNLTSLWLLAAEPFNAYKNTGPFNVIELDFSEWPNRVWENAGNFETAHVKEVLLQSTTALTFSKWNALEVEEHKEAAHLGLQVKSIQIGMSLSLEQYKLENFSHTIILEKIKTSEKANLWSEVFRQCFGYSISPEVVAAIMEKANFSLITRNQETVGCVLTFIKNNQIGIHSLGILNQYRKQGLAEMVMHHLLRAAKKNGLENAHLQSSMLGLGIYRKIGFTGIFKMCNYKI